MTTNPKGGFSLLLKESGLKATPHRLELLRLLANAKKPASAHEVKALWKGSIDTVTIYRMLEALAEAKIVRRVNLQHGHTDYELVGDEHHHHVVCTGCGVIEDLEGCPDKRIETSALAKTKMFAALDEHALEFFGICKECVATA